MRRFKVAWAAATLLSVTATVALGGGSGHPWESTIRVVPLVNPKEG